ncbi:MAG: amino acid ABC transporter permease [Deltaproteobacteria bacterium]|nr:MAG: amino acid ABC transporter permease [Deltaproteobacteria bacterium]
MTKRFTRLDMAVLLFAAAAAAFIIYRLFFALEYNWNWSVIPAYMFRFDQETGSWQMNMLMQGLMTTIKLSIWGTLFAAVFGMWMGLMRTSPRLFNRLVGTSYVEIIRNLPPLVLVFIFYFFVSDQLMPLLGVEDFFRSLPPDRQRYISLLLTDSRQITPFLSGVITIGLFQGAYITEIVRGGIQSIPSGQWEASAASGLGRWQQMRLVILPQAARIMLPPLANEFINTIKYSSIVSIISIQELTFQGSQVMASTQVTLEIWITITLIYLVLCFSLSLLVGWLERKTASGGKAAAC